MTKGEARMSRAGSRRSECVVVVEKSEGRTGKRTRETPNMEFVREWASGGVWQLKVPL